MLGDRGVVSVQGRTRRLARLGRVGVGGPTRDGVAGEGHRRIGRRNRYLLRPHVRLALRSAPKPRSGPSFVWGSPLRSRSLLREKKLVDLAGTKVRCNGP